jgi:predicted membrane protein
MRQLDFPFFPYWIFTWPMILIVIGLFVGIKSKFTNVAWLVMVLIGGFFLLSHNDFLDWDMHRYAWPLGIIVIGLFLIFRSVIAPSRSSIDGDIKYSNLYNTGTDTDTNDEKKSTMNTGDDYLNSINVFGGTKKRIYSKSFKGGQTTNFFGGTDIDLTQADVQKPAVIDIVQVFGGVKLVVPANWEIKSEVVSIFGGFNDKRNMPSSTQDTSKMIVLTGVCIFGGIDIKSY